MNFGFRALDVLWSGALQTLRRFPAVLAMSFAAGLAAYDCVLKKQSYETSIELWGVFTLSIPLSFAISLMWENKRLRMGWKILATIAAIASLAAFYAAFRRDSQEVQLIRFALLSLAFHLLVAFAPFVRGGTSEGFWKFNEQLFLRILASVLYSAVLYCGISVCLVTAHFLLKIKFPEEIYVWLFLFMAFVFNTWFFLAKIPDADIAELRELPDYPRGLKIFTQYTLIPVNTVYLFILYAYLARILVQWTWPQGMVGYLVSCAAIVGIFALLLIHPVQNQSENRWIKIYSRGFYLALIPLLALMYSGTWKRISEYGITEKRYLLLVLDLWLTGLVVYFTFSRRRSIKVIPISLCLITLFATFGPWGAFSISLRSQKHELKELLEKNGRFDEGTIKKSEAEVSIEDQISINSTIEYLNRVHGAPVLAEWFGEDYANQKVTDKLYAPKELSREMVKLVGVPYRDSWSHSEQTYFSLNVPYEGVKSRRVTGFDYVLEFSVSSSRSAQAFKLEEGREIKVHFLEDSLTLEVTEKDKTIAKFDLNEVTQLAISKKREPAQPGERTLHSKTSVAKAQFIVEGLTGQLVEEKRQLNWVSGALFFKF